MDLLRADCYTWLCGDEPAEEHAREIIAYHTRPDGSSNAPMPSANSHMTWPSSAPRHGDLDEAVHHGLTAFGYDRKPKPRSYPARPTSTASSPSDTPVNGWLMTSTSGTWSHTQPYGAGPTR